MIKMYRKTYASICCLVRYITKAKTRLDVDQ
jgi:hypothetical protein